MCHGPTCLTAIRAACNHLEIPIGAAETGAGQFAHSGGQPAPPPATDIRTLKERKSPVSVAEMACLVAYYLQSIAPLQDRKQTITSADLDTYFRQADFPLPKRMMQVLVDAKGAGYFDSAGRGAYRLNAVGHNLIVHTLPRTSDRGTGAVLPRVRRRSANSGRKRKRA
jgi:hypothetical protein